MTPHTARRSGWVGGIALAAVVSLAGGCGNEVVQTSSAQDLAKAGVPVEDDLPTSAPFDGWAPNPPRFDGDTVDPSFSRCGDPANSTSFGEAAVEPEEHLSSPVFGGVADSATLISVEVRGSSLVFEDAAAAQAAFAKLDEKAFTPCITGSVDPTADAPEVTFESAGDGEEARRLDLSLDDYEYFQGNDNGTELHLRVVRVGRVVSVMQFVYSGQYFEDIDSDLATLQNDVSAAVVERLQG